MKKLLSGFLAFVMTITPLCIPAYAYEHIGIMADEVEDFFKYNGESFLSFSENDGYCMVIESDHSNYLNQWGEPLLPAQKHNFVWPFSEGRAFVMRDGLYGAIDTSGAVVLPFQYENVCPLGYSGGLTGVSLNGQWLYINYNGETVHTAPPNYDVAQVEDGYAVLRSPVGVYAMHDIERDLIEFSPINGYGTIRPIGNGLFIVDGDRYEKPDYKALVSIDGRVILPDEFNLIIPYEAYGLIDVSRYEWDLETMADWTEYSGVLDFDGNIIFPIQSEVGVYVLSEDSLIVYDSDMEALHAGLIDLDGNELLPRQYDTIYNHFNDNGLYLAKRSFGTGIWELIDKHGNIISTLPECFDDKDVVFLSDGLVVYRGANEEMLQLSDREGTILMEIPAPWNHDVYPFEEGGTWYYDPDENSDHELIRVLNPLLKEQTSDWAQGIVEEAEKLSLITPSNQGYYTFRITRRRFAELAVGLVEQVLGETITPAPAERFTDTQDEWCRKAAAIGLINGINDGTAFSPNGYISREQLSLVLQRTISYLEERTGTTVLSGKADLSVYVDAKEISPWAQDALAELVEAGILQGGADATLNPHGSTTVEQALALILRTYQQFKQEK